jgi:hypothetical protein
MRNLDSVSSLSPKGRLAGMPSHWKCTPCMDSSLAAVVLVADAIAGHEDGRLVGIAVTSRTLALVITRGNAARTSDS